MNTGMLWFDNDNSTTISAKIERAIKYYQKKYDRAPNICYLNPQTLNGADYGNTQKAKEKGKELILGEIKVQKTSLVLPNHFWIGVDNGQTHANPT
ncbi:MAG: hypothetical protein U9O54_02675 [Chloroflexota bacterium]|nr:hypothetical protein [Chloroflexota bacterium]